MASARRSIRSNSVSCILVLALLGTGLKASMWRPVGYPLDVSSISCLYENPFTGDLIVGGGQLLYAGTDSAMFAVLRYREGLWDTLCRVNQPVHAVVWFDDKLIIAGNFTVVEGQNVARIAYLSGGMWLPYGNFDGAIHCLKELEGSLYAAGSFLQCDGNIASGVAVRTELGWDPVGLIPFITPPTVRDLEIYGGELIATGLIRCGAFKDLVRFDGTGWYPVGANGILGGISGGATLEVFDGDLIIGGTIDIASGNAGHAIMGWNGEQFYALGIGPQYVQGSYQFLFRVNDVVVHHGLLFAVGGFNYVDLVPASRVAVWDGQSWCSLGGDIEGELRVMAFYRDTLVVASWGEQGFDGIDMNNVAAYQVLNYADTCASPVAVDERTRAREVAVYPNPTSGMVTLDIDIPGPVYVEVRCLDGRLLKVVQLGPGERSMELKRGAVGEVLILEVSHGSRRYAPQRVILLQD